MSHVWPIENQVFCNLYVLVYHQISSNIFLFAPFAFLESWLSYHENILYIYIYIYIYIIGFNPTKSSTGTPHVSSLILPTINPNKAGFFQGSFFLEGGEVFNLTPLLHISRITDPISIQF